MLHSVQRGWKQGPGGLQALGLSHPGHRTWRVGPTTSGPWRVSLSLATQALPSLLAGLQSAALPSLPRSFFQGRQGGGVLDVTQLLLLLVWERELCGAAGGGALCGASSESLL